MQNWAFKELAFWLALFTAYYGFAAYAGAPAMNNFHGFMFGDYITLWHQHFLPRLPALTNPFILVLIALAVWRLRIRGLVLLSRQIAAIIAAFFLVRVVVLVLGVYPVSVTLPDTLKGLCALVWYMVTIGFTDPAKWQALRERLGAD